MDDLFFVNRWVVAGAFEEFVEAQFVEHVEGVGIVEGSDAEGDVVEGFDENAAEADHDDGTEEGVAF